MKPEVPYSLKFVGSSICESGSVSNTPVLVGSKFYTSRLWYWAGCVDMIACFRLDVRIGTRAFVHQIDPSDISGPYLIRLPVACPISYLPLAMHQIAPVYYTWSQTMFSSLAIHSKGRQQQPSLAVLGDIIWCLRIWPFERPRLGSAIR